VQRRFLRTPDANVNGVLLDQADLKVFLKHEKGRKFLQSLLDLGKEIKVVAGYQWSREIQLPCEEELMHREEWSKRDYELHVLLIYGESVDDCYSLGEWHFCPKVFVFKKPYHTLKHLIEWIGEDAILRGKKNFDVVYEEIRRLCRIVGIPVDD
jgi:hypothetical protein